MITDLNKAIELVSKDWREYFNLAEDLRESEEILNIVLRADDLFANGSRYFHHLFWRDDHKIAENNLLEYEDVLLLVEEAQDNFLDNLEFPDSSIPAYLMDEDEVFERYNLHIEIDDFDGELTDEFGAEGAEDIRERLEQVIDDRVLASCRRSFQDERVANYISLNPDEPNSNLKQVKAACLIHIDNLFLAPKEFFTEENLYQVFEEHHKALDITPRQTWWYSSDIDKLLKHINELFPLSDLKIDSRLVQSMIKVDQNKKSLGQLIDLSSSDDNDTSYFDDMPLEDYSEEALIEHLEKKPYDFKQLTHEQQTTRSIALAAVKAHGHLLANCDEVFKADREFVLAAVKYNGSCIQYASDELQNNREFVKECIALDGYTLEHIKNDVFLNDKELALLAIENYPSPSGIIKKLNANLKNDPEIILAGLKKYYTSLEAASDDLHNNRDFILKCVNINGCTLGLLKNEDFKNDREIVEQALDNLGEDAAKWDTIANGIAKNIGSDLKSDRSIVDKILKVNPYTISYFSNFDFNQQEVLDFINTNPKTYRHLSEEHKNDLEIINRVIEKDPSMYSELNPSYKDNADLAFKAIQLKPLLYTELSKNLKENDRIISFILNNPIPRNN